MYPEKPDSLTVGKSKSRPYGRLNMGKMDMYWVTKNSNIKYTNIRLSKVRRANGATSNKK